MAGQARGSPGSRTHRAPGSAPGGRSRQGSRGSAPADPVAILGGGAGRNRPFAHVPTRGKSPGPSSQHFPRQTEPLPSELQSYCVSACGEGGRLETPFGGHGSGSGRCSFGAADEGRAGVYSERRGGGDPGVGADSHGGRGSGFSPHPAPLRACGSTQRPPGGRAECGQRPRGRSWTTGDRLPPGLAGVSGSRAAQSSPPAAGAHLSGGMPLGRFQTCRWVGPLDER